MLTLIRTAYFQDFVESLVNGVLIFNSSGQIYVANDAAASILGCGCDKIMAMNWSQVFEGLDDKAGIDVFLAKAQAQDRDIRPIQTRYFRKDGRTLHLNISASLLIEYQKVFGIMVMITDVTHIIELHEREKEILQERNRLAKERFESLQNLAAAIAHQIRNPIVSIAGFANLLLKKANENKDLKEYLEVIVSSGKRLEEIVKAVSDYNALCSKDANPQPVTDVLDECVERFARSGGPAGPDLRVDAEPAMLELDKTAFCVALLEILVNAREAANGKTAEISITGRLQDGLYRLDIHDHGPGMAEDVLPYVKDPFFTTKAVGVGMGLTRAEKVIGEHHGRLSLENAPEGGTVAVITLPLATPASEGPQ